MGGRVCSTDGVSSLKKKKLLRGVEKLPTFLKNPFIISCKNRPLGLLNIL